MKPVIRYLERRRYQEALKHIQGYLLDIGCGTNQLVKSYGHGIGVDVYPWPGADKVVSSSSDLPFANQEFDTATLLACINHIPDRVATLREVHRVLKDSGKLIVSSVPFPKLMEYWHRLVERWDEDQHERCMEEEEEYGLSLNEIYRVFHEAGFEVMARERFIFRLNNLFVARKLP